MSAETDVYIKRGGHLGAPLRILGPVVRANEIVDSTAAGDYFAAGVLAAITSPRVAGHLGIALGMRFAAAKLPSGDPVFTELRGVIDGVVADLQRTRDATPEGWESAQPDPRDPVGHESHAEPTTLPATRDEAESEAVFCRRGHFMGVGADAAWHCRDCGARAVSSCARCTAPVPPPSGEPPSPASFCEACGAPFPWVDRRGRIFELENLIAHQELDPSTALALREELEALTDPNLSEEEERRRWERVRAMAPEQWRSGRSILESVVGAAVRKRLEL